MPEDLLGKDSLWLWQGIGCLTTAEEFRVQVASSCIYAKQYWFVLGGAGSVQGGRSCQKLPIPNRQPTLKDKTTQLLRSKSGALVTQIKINRIGIQSEK